jgi:DNA uptake protein ComE-like DNA-binding protein
MKLATSLLVAALALAPALAFAKDTKATTTNTMMTKTTTAAKTTSAPVNVNTASEDELLKVFKKKVADNVIKNRNYSDAKELASKNKGLITPASATNLTKKGKISFE